MRIRNWHLCTTALITCLSVVGTAHAVVIKEVDVIPFAISAETQQNAEPSIGVNPLNTSQLVSGAFTGIFNGPPTNVTTPYWQSTDAGTTWTGFGTLQTLDKSIAWAPNGSTNALTATLNGVGGGNNQIQTFLGGVPGVGFTTNQNNFNPSAFLDQPWIRTGPSNLGTPNTASQQNVYVGYNDLSKFGTGVGQGHTASVNVSTTLGASPTVVPLELRTPGVGQDAPSIREAADQSGTTKTVYAVFTQWNTVLSTTGGGDRFGSNVLVRKSTDFGVTFNGLGNAGNGFTSSVVATNNAVSSPFTTTDNSLVSVGQERIGSDNAIAIDPKNANHVVVAYADAPTIGQLQVHVAESTDGGTTWNNKFTSAATTRSGTPALTIKDDGTIALLYNEYNPQTDKITQHLVTTGNDFATTTDTILATENNSTSGGPAPQFDPYVGDFTDLTSVGNVLFGIFSASNADNGTLATYLNNTPSLFQRCFTGTPGTASFALCDGLGHAVPFSIDPIFFSLDENVIITPEPGTLALLATSLFGLAALRRCRK
jgi:hypothetical protein